MPDFGVNGGGLTDLEAELLSGAMNTYVGDCRSAGLPVRVLELGHYCGQSTWAIYCGLEDANPGAPFEFHTIDHYQGDGDMPPPTMVGAREKFAANHRELMDERVVVHEGDMDTMDPEGYGAVFYDADHGPRQLEYAKRIDATTSVLLVVMDDAGLLPGVDVAVAFLGDRGWREVGAARQGRKFTTNGNSLAVLVR